MAYDYDLATRVRVYLSNMEELQVEERKGS